MGKAADFRLVFGRIVEASTSAERVFDGFAGASGTGAKASKDYLGGSVRRASGFVQTALPDFICRAAPEYWAI
jgi:hypothetical protein